MAPHHDDQRTSPRAPLRLRVDYERMNSFFADYTRNLSKGGTFIKTHRPLPPGTRCLFAFSLPALSEPVQLEGEVAWVRTLADAKELGEDAGMGVRFLFRDAAARREFEELVARVMADSLGGAVARGLLARR